MTTTGTNTENGFAADYERLVVGTIYA